MDADIERHRLAGAGRHRRLHSVSQSDLEQMSGCLRLSWSITRSLENYIPGVSRLFSRYLSCGLSHKGITRSSGETITNLIGERLEEGTLAFRFRAATARVVVLRRGRTSLCRSPAAFFHQRLFPSLSSTISILLRGRFLRFPHFSTVTRRATGCLWYVSGLSGRTNVAGYKITGFPGVF